MFLVFKIQSDFCFSNTKKNLLDFYFGAKIQIFSLIKMKLFRFFHYFGAKIQINFCLSNTEIFFILARNFKYLLVGVDEEVLPALMTSLEPLLTLLMNQPVDNLDLPTILSYAAQTLQKSKIQVSLSSNLGDLDFIKIGK